MRGAGHPCTVTPDPARHPPGVLQLSQRSTHLAIRTSGPLLQLHHQQPVGDAWGPARPYIHQRPPPNCTDSGPRAMILGACSRPRSVNAHARGTRPGRSRSASSRASTSNASFNRCRQARTDSSDSPDVRANSATVTRRPDDKSSSAATTRHRFGVDAGIARTTGMTPNPTPRSGRARSVRTCPRLIARPPAPCAPHARPPRRPAPHAPRIAQPRTGTPHDRTRTSRQELACGGPGPSSRPSTAGDLVPQAAGSPRHEQQERRDRNQRA